VNDVFKTAGCESVFIVKSFPRAVVEIVQLLMEGLDAPEIEIPVVQEEIELADMEGLDAPEIEIPVVQEEIELADMEGLDAPKIEIPIVPPEISHL
jgi:hypothetical protein